MSFSGPLQRVRFAKNAIQDLLWRLRHGQGGLRDRALAERLRRATTPGDLYDLLSGVLPPHQIRSEITAFLALAVSRPHAVVGEIGLGQGGTHVLMSWALPGIRKLIGLDLFVRNRPQIRRLARPVPDHLLAHGDSTAPGTVRRVRDFLGNDLLDVLLIDGDHTLEGVRRDFELYRSLVRPGGLVAFHDIVPDHFQRYGRPTIAWAGGVPQYWAHLKPAWQTEEFVEHADQNGCGIGVLRMPAST
jgi:predicted O-methyltransferase YrrM